MFCLTTWALQITSVIFEALYEEYYSSISKNVRYCLLYSLLYPTLPLPHALEALILQARLFPPVNRALGYQSRFSGHREPGLHVSQVGLFVYAHPFSERCTLC